MVKIESRRGLLQEQYQVQQLCARATVYVVDCSAKSAQHLHFLV